MSTTPLPARVTDIGEFIRHRSCQRRFKLAHDNRALYEQLPFAKQPFHVLDPVLMAAGKRREDQWAQSLIQAGLVRLDSPQAPEIAWREVADKLGQLAHGTRAFAREVTLEGREGAFALSGRIDFVVLLWREGQPVLRLVECKASRRDRTYHRIQVALYRLLLEQQLEARPVSIAGCVLTTVECVVARIDESNGALQPILEIEPFPQIETLLADARSLLAEGGSLQSILQTKLDRLSFQLEGKCDDCTFSPHCFAESARQRRLELLGASPSTVRTLTTAGITTLDDLAQATPDGPAKAFLKTRGGLDQHFEDLQVQARARRATLPGGRDERPVLPRPFAGKGQLPPHEVDGHRVVRVYLSVSYDYVEDRVAALAAHVTKSSGELATPFRDTPDGRRKPVAGVQEQFFETTPGSQQRTLTNTTPVQGLDLIRFQTVPWSGRYEQDTGAELALLQGFFRELVEAIGEVGDAPTAPLHFYVWSRMEMTRLLEACSRAGSGLLAHLRELMGCRESLEQLIFSVVQDEVFTRFALGYTSRGLTVATAVAWYGQRYHWLRKVGYHHREVDLGRAFLRDLFDFRARLSFETLPTGDLVWTQDQERELPEAQRHRFEVRGRFHDNLSAPYFHAYWGTLPQPEQLADSPRLRQAVVDYHAAAQPGYLKSYLAARVHALRWLEERVRWKNRDIQKPLVRLDMLPRFTLGTRHAADAAVDFLRLDHHVKVQDWVRAHLIAPITRVARGQSIPLKNLRVTKRVKPGAKRDKHGQPYTETVVVGEVDTALADNVHELATRVGIGEGDFVRLTRRSENPHEGQRYSDLTFGKTCIIKEVNWQAGTVTMAVIVGKTGKRYVLPSFNFEPRSDDPRRHPFAYATVDASVSDYVADRVEQRLLDTPQNPLRGRHILAWFDPTTPKIPAMRPLPHALADELRTLLAGLKIGPGQHPLVPRRVDVIVEGLQHRIQLVQGPPGTGKTMLTAIAVLARVLALHGTSTVILVAANTHTAVDTLLLRIAREVEQFAVQAEALGLRCPAVKLAKASSGDDPPPAPLEALNPTACLRQITSWRRGATVIIGGTSATLLKLVERGLNPKAEYRKRTNGFQTPLLVVDEASMMVFSHFLALATLVEADGQIMLAGDHRQLSPIVAHDWESEDRPPTVLYKPFVSAYEAVDRLCANYPGPDQVVCTHKLSHTYRLPPVIRHLIQPLYSRDGIELTGPEEVPTRSTWDPTKPWEAVWKSGHRLYLVIHDEANSEHQNPTEVAIIHKFLAANPDPQPGAIAVVTPHRSQRAFLREAITPLGDAVDTVDTVERLQGGERPTIVFSATESDPIVIHQRVEFILNLNRSNVAFSRTQQRLIVVCARTLLEHVPTEAAQYESALLWKHLRKLCATRLASCSVEGVRVQIFVTMSSDRISSPKHELRCSPDPGMYL